MSSAEADQIDISGDGGILKQILVEGTGESTPPLNSKVSVHYTGTLLDGTKFDSSVDRGTPFDFTIGKGQVIKAWDQGVATMKKGEKAILTCAPKYAYGGSGSPPKIPANATLKFEVELLDWNDMTDVNSDGSVKKKMTKSAEAGDYKSPNDYSTCEVSYSLKHGDKVVLEKSKASVEIGLDASIPQGLEDVIKSLKAGEICEVEIAPSHGYGLDGAASLGIPPNATLTGTVELHSFQKGADKWAMKQPEKISYAEKRKNIGNDLFKAGNFLRALKFYQAALSHIEYESDLSAEGKQALATIHSNIAAVHVKMNQFADAKKSCDSALKQDQNNVKALFRRAQAEVGLGAPEDAISDLKKALQLEPSNAAVKSLLVKCKGSLKANREKQKSAFGGIFERLAKVEEKEAASSKSEERSESGEPVFAETKSEDRMETESIPVSSA